MVVFNKLWKEIKTPFSVPFSAYDPRPKRKIMASMARDKDAGVATLQIIAFSVSEQNDKYILYSSSLSNSMLTFTSFLMQKHGQGYYEQGPFVCDGP